jgi:hypothetical protein
MGQARPLENVSIMLVSPDGLGMRCPVSGETCPGTGPDCRCQSLTRELVDGGARVTQCFGHSEALGAYWLMKSHGAPPRIVITEWILGLKGSPAWCLAQAIGDMSGVTCHTLLTNVRLMDSDATVIIQAEDQDSVDIEDTWRNDTYILRHPVGADMVADILDVDRQRRSKRKTMEFSVPSMREATDSYWRGAHARERVVNEVLLGYQQLQRKHEVTVRVTRDHHPSDEDEGTLCVERHSALEA